ncbi:MAG: non-hydrolyzing UDP-N-acetylglucosamine 2-epimerase [Candidatus Saccharicenans sp.]
MKTTRDIEIKKILVVMGTRPEVIKLAPVIEALKDRAREKAISPTKKKRILFKTVICLTGQHREMVEPFLKVFGLKPDYDLRVMQPEQHLAELTGRVLAGMKKVLEAEKPDWLLVQGDTTSAMAAALAAFYQRIKIGHVEAGLRTDDKYNPFPEEINRRLISHLADLHFAPTELAKKNLLAEGIKPEKIVVTGNTVVDALKMILKRTAWKEKGQVGGQRVILRIKKIKEEQQKGTGKGKQREVLEEGRKGEGKGARKEGAGTEIEKAQYSSRAEMADTTAIPARAVQMVAGEAGSGTKSGDGAGLVQSDRANLVPSATLVTDVLSLAEIKKIKKLIMVTAHRRESFGKGMEGICQAILRVVEKVKEAEVIFPVHMNPAVRKVVFRYLLGRERIHLVEPLDYITFVHLMKRASLILTDSGGIQEEAPSLGVPVVVMRETTERPEAIWAGVAWLGGTDPEKITSLALRLLKKVESGEFRKRLRKRNPFGDGRAGHRISLKIRDTL